MRIVLFFTLALAAWLTVHADGSDEPIVSEPEPFEYSLARRGTATVGDAYYVFALMARRQGRLPAHFSIETASFEELRDNLIEICVISNRWKLESNDCLKRDVLAYMSLRYVGYRAGLLTGLFGPTRRYAFREMQHRGLVAPGNPHTIVTGSELLSVATRVSVRTAPHPAPTLTPDEVH